MCRYGNPTIGRANLLYHSKGDGTFEEVGAGMGVQIPNLPSFLARLSNLLG